jgi:hypothetical protein
MLGVADGAMLGLMLVEALAEAAAADGDADGDGPPVTAGWPHAAATRTSETVPAIHDQRRDRLRMATGCPAWRSPPRPERHEAPDRHHLVR